MKEVLIVNWYCICECVNQAKLPQYTSARFSMKSRAITKKKTYRDDRSL